MVLSLAGLSIPACPARDLRLTLPKHSQATPVQKLNREGVKALEKHRLDKAEHLFYKAYLIDPDDPFTLNNLGYISELQGKVDRAERYYELAGKVNNSETVIAAASERKLRGRKLSEVTGAYGNLELRINRGNVLAMSLLEHRRNQEAEDLLRETLKLDPRNPFTLNNLGFAMEGQGDLESALRYYNEASMTHSSEPVIVAINPGWRGKRISDIAFHNVVAVRERLAQEKTNQQRAARMNVEGVAALNHNNSDKALGFFEQAYQLDPRNAFSLNNMGYLSEARGDQETADEFYSLARHGGQSGTAVSLASHNEMVGEAVANVAAANAQGTQANLAAEAESKRRKREPIVLKRRDNAPLTGPPTSTPAQPRRGPRPPLDNAPVESPIPPAPPQK